MLAIDEPLAGRQHLRHLFCFTRRDLVQTPSVWESLQLVTAAELELHLRYRADELAHDLRDQDLAALGLAGDASRHVDRGAEDIARFLHHLAGVDPDPDAQLSLGVLLAVLGDRLLDVQRALDAMPRGAEADHETVAETLDPSACVLADLLIDDRLVRLHDLVGGRETARGEKARRLFDVGEHDRDRALGLADS